MITISTGDLLGVIGDAIPFALDDEEFPEVSNLRLEWDGDMLHATTTDLYRIGWASWHPDDDPDAGGQDNLLTEWGGADDPWAVYVSLANAKHLIKTYKLPFKRRRAPLEVEFVEHLDSPSELIVRRRLWTGHTSITTVIEALLLDNPPKHPRDVLAAADTVTPAGQLVYNANWLADFAKVRARGPLELTITGETGPTLVTIGKRFVGAIKPMGPEEREARGTGEGA